MGHIVLLGDSIFDNARYVPGGPPVVEQLRRSVPCDWNVSLLAVDGSVACQVAGQLAKLPSDATHLVVSVGGNDALDHSSTILHESASSFVGVMSQLAEIRRDFQQRYRAMLDAVLERELPVALCTIYDAIPGLHDAEHAGLCLFNDVIMREGFRSSIPVIDLRLVCHEAADYAASSPIEPSVQGGAKIARTIAYLISQHDFSSAGRRVYV